MEVDVVDIGAVGFGFCRGEVVENLFGQSTGAVSHGGAV